MWNKFIKISKKVLCNKRGGFDILKMLGLKKKGVDMSPITNAVMPYKSLTEIPVGATLNDKILAGLKGQGWGYDPSFLEKTTSPVVAEREARFKQEEMPFISGEMSSRGLGRSNIAQTAINEATGQKERDINQIIATAYAANEQQKKADEARYESLGSQWAGQEAATRGAYSGADMAKGQVLVGAEQARKIADEQSLNRLIGTGLAVGAAPFTGGASLLAIPAMYGGGNANPDLWASALQRAQNTNTSTDVSPFTKKTISNVTSSPMTRVSGFPKY